MYLFSSTRGLDASTALEFVRALRIATDNLGLTSIVSIYQASELLYKVNSLYIYFTDLISPINQIALR